MSRIPTGCLLIRMGVFESLAPPFFRFETDPASGAILGEDYVFCDAVRRAGFRIWCDPTLTQEMGHIGQQIFRVPPPPAQAASENGLSPLQRLYGSLEPRGPWTRRTTAPLNVRTSCSVRAMRWNMLRRLRRITGCLPSGRKKPAAVSSVSR